MPCRSNSFSTDQYIDIFRFISKDIQDIVHNYYVDAHGFNLPVIIGQVYQQNVETDKKSEQKKYEKIHLTALGKFYQRDDIFGFRPTGAGQFC